MSLDLQKLFIGLVDFFSILMPGAILTQASERSELALDPKAGLIFLFWSYLLGHLAFLVSSFLDKVAYDPIRRWTAHGQMKRLADGEALSPQWKRRLASSPALFGSDADDLVRILRIKARWLHTLGANAAINAYQWCKVMLAKDMPECLMAVQRFEANSKFFRSFVVALIVLVCVYARRGAFDLAALCTIAIVPSFWRYVDQRFKGTQRAYWHVIELEARKPGPLRDCPRNDGLTHAGGVVCRQGASGLEVLLVEASRDRSQWVLPKGHIEPGEDPRETAVREVLEETGHHARIRHSIDDAPLSEQASEVRVRWYLLESVESAPGPARVVAAPREDMSADQWPEEARQHKWLSAEAAEALEGVTFKKTQELIARAAELWKRRCETVKPRPRTGLGRFFAFLTGE